MTAMDAALQDIRKAGALAAAIVSRDGTVLEADLPPGVSRETFSIMCATIHGASMTVSAELHRGKPRRIVIEVDAGRVMILEAGRRALAVLVLTANTDPATLADDLRPLMERVAREIG